MLYIHEYLLHGKENAIHASELSAMLDMSSREIRKAAERERNAGVPIIADEHGYYLPSTDPLIAREELSRCIAKNRAAAKSTLVMAGKLQEYRDGLK